MDAAQTEKLKALALATAPIETDLYGSRYFDSYFSSAELTKEQDDFITAIPPATVLELIADHDKTMLERDELRAEVERLRADLETAVKEAWRANSELSALKVAAPAAGTEKDAERYRTLRDLMHSAKGGASLSVNAEFAYYEKPEPGEEVRFQFYPNTPIGSYSFDGTTLDEVADAVVDQFGAHTKAREGA